MYVSVYICMYGVYYMYVSRCFFACMQSSIAERILKYSKHEHSFMSMLYDYILKFTKKQLFSEIKDNSYY